MPIIRNPQQTQQNPNPFGVAGTYIIDSVVNYTSGFTIQANVTIIFIAEGMITCEGTTNGIIIKGNNTRLIAPISQIFGAKVKVEGYWTVDRTYPQWFCNLGYRYSEGGSAGSEYADSTTDWSEAINKAITMKGTGEVMIPRGHYFIQKPIQVNFGITLMGECGRISSPEGSNIHAYGTCIEAGGNYIDISTDNSTTAPMVYVNKNGNNWMFNYPTPVTKIWNLELRGLRKAIPNTNIILCYMTGIMSYGACVIDTIMFNNLSSGIHFFDGLYSDARQVYNCVFGYNNSYTYKTGCYAIDCECLGDAVTIKNNHMAGPNVVGALRLRLCGGGTISSNILNGDVLIKSCKNVVYECNHMEYNAQLNITTSNVAVRRNFFEKREKCCVVIEGNDFLDESIVDLEGNAYNCYEYSSRMGGEYGAYNIANVSQTDVKIDKHSIVNIKDEYRYWGSKGTMAKMYTFGIQIENLNGNSAAFNDNSHIYSKLSCIQLGKIVPRTFELSGSIPQIIQASTNRGIEWLCASGRYRYDSVIINEIAQQSPSNYTFDLEHRTFPADQDLLEESGGVLFQFSGSSQNTRNVKVQMNRCRIVNGTCVERKQITLYVCGAAFLYDNGITISGYKWVDV